MERAYTGLIVKYRQHSTYSENTQYQNMMKILNGSQRSVLFVCTLTHIIHQGRAGEGGGGAAFMSATPSVA